MNSAPEPITLSNFAFHYKYIHTDTHIWSCFRLLMNILSNTCVAHVCNFKNVTKNKTKQKTHGPSVFPAIHTSLSVINIREMQVGI